MNFFGATNNRVAITRREGLACLGLTAGTALVGSALASSAHALETKVVPRKVRVAAIFTEFTYRSHAHVILENFLKPYVFCGKRVEPNMEIVAMWGDQFPEGDMSRQVSRDFNIPILPTIHEALTLGGKELACDAVLSIAEHGKYPMNELGQQMYPRKRFFDEIVKTMQSTNTFVPLFNDKHLSYRWDWAHEMATTAQRLGIPFMAGSSVPMAHRKPPLELPAHCQFDELLLVHGGGPDSYDFHALEVLQSLVEARRGGESGVQRVQCLEGDAVWKAAEQRLWNPDLVEVALRPELGDEAKDWKAKSPNPYLILVHYQDGLIAPLITVPGNRWAFACKLTGEAAPRGCQFHVGPWLNRNLFKALSHAIQHLFATRSAPYPLERTLLTTGITEAVMKSRKAGFMPIETPHLQLAYQPVDFSKFRENGESWKVLTYDVPEPQGVDPLGGITLP